jgi:hypothetical protein
VRRFEPGEPIALRERWRGRVWVARPATVVVDEPGLLMFAIPPGTRWFGPAGTQDGWIRLKAPGATWTLEPRRWTGAHVLSFAWPGSGHAVLHLWDDAWTPRCWYVNVEAPLRRSAVGFDTFDQDLDVVIEPDRSSWRWKDEDVVAEGIRLGVYSEREAAAFRREAERGLRRVLERRPPFDREWDAWRPDPAWAPPVLPDGWDRP